MEYVRSPLLWSGSKYDLLDAILPRISGRLWEPFCGSAVVALNYQGESVISDRNGQLMSFWRWAKEGTIPSSVGFEWTENEYYKIREYNNDWRMFGPLTRAVNFLYLNRTCWRGLYRENSKGEFNVPWGARKRVEWPAMPDMSRVVVLPGSTNYWEAEVPGGIDTIYCDPPYLGTHSYGVKFDHERFAKWCNSRTERVLVSNSPAAVELFPGWHVTELTVKGGIGHKRSEVLLWNGK